MFSSLGIALMTINSLIIFRIVLGMQVENCSKRGQRSLHSLRAKVSFFLFFQTRSPHAAQVGYKLILPMLASQVLKFQAQTTLPSSKVEMCFITIVPSNIQHLLRLILKLEIYSLPFKNTTTTTTTISVCDMHWAHVPQQGVEVRECPESLSCHVGFPAGAFYLFETDHPFSH